MTQISNLNPEHSTTRNLVSGDSEYITKALELLNQPEDKFKTDLFLSSSDDRTEQGGLRTKGYFKVPASWNPSTCLKTDAIRKPLVTIITVAYNCEKFIEETINSVVNQNYENVEYIIIDGGSTDGTVDILRRYDDLIDYWISERDEGMYDAINKALKLAQGDYINFINADDYFCDSNVVSHVVDLMAEKQAQSLYGKSRYVDAAGGILLEKKPLRYKKRYLRTLGLFFTQPTFFWRRDLIKKIGLIDTNYKIAADYDFIANILLNCKHVARSDKYIACFRVFGDSFGDKNTKHARKEFLLINSKFDFPLSGLVGFYDRVIQKLHQYLD